MNQRATSAPLSQTLHWAASLWRALQISMGMGCLVALIYAWHWLHSPHTLPIQTITISGLINHVDKNQLQQLCTPALHMGLFAYDIDGLTQRLQRLAWVKEISIQRVFPDHLKIWVHEQHARAQWNDGLLLNARGELFRVPLATVPFSITKLFGPLGEEKNVLAQFYQMQKIFAQTPLKITLLRMSNSGVYELGFAQDFTLSVGHENTMLQLQKFARIYPQLVTNAEAHQKIIRHVDLRYAHGVAVQHEPYILTPTTWQSLDAPSTTQQEQIKNHG